MYRALKVPAFSGILASVCASLCKGENATLHFEQKAVRVAQTPVHAVWKCAAHDSYLVAALAAAGGLQATAAALLLLASAIGVLV